jgi:hypothetical protein
MNNEDDDVVRKVEFSGDSLGDESFVLRFRTSKMKVRELVVEAVGEYVRNQIAKGYVVARKPRRRHLAPMTGHQIRQEAKRGSVGARRGPREIDPAKEVAKATRALRERRIRVFVDGNEMESPDAEVVLAPWTKVIFVRALRRGAY